MILLANDENILIAAQALKSGNLVAFPTETVYGLGADARSDSAIKKIYSSKGRPSNNPLIVHLSSPELIGQIADLESTEQGLRAKFWIRKLAEFMPGPLSLVLPNPIGISSLATAGQSSVAVRVPNHPIALALLKSCEIPVAAPSANRSSYISPTTAKHVESEFPKDECLILDGGPCQLGIESTVLSLLEGSPRILRPGFITQEDLSTRLGERVLNNDLKSDSPLLSPGMLAKHYSPHTPLKLIESVDFKELLALPNSGYISTSGATPKGACLNLINLNPSNDLSVVAKNLYGALRDLDKRGLKEIIVETCETKGLGTAIMDRLIRASTS